LHVSAFFGHEECIKVLLVTKPPTILPWQQKQNQPILEDGIVSLTKQLPDGVVDPLATPPPPYEPEDYIVVEFRDVFGNVPLLYALGHHEADAFPHRNRTPGKGKQNVKHRAASTPASPVAAGGDIGGIQDGMIAFPSLKKKFEIFFKFKFHVANLPKMPLRINLASDLYFVSKIKIKEES